MDKDLQKLIKQTGTPWLANGLVYAHVAGSHLYGTATETSDKDIRGYFIAPPSYWIGINTIDSIVTEIDGVDWHLWDFRKWINLTLKNNPNVLETLYANNSVYETYLHKHFLEIMGDPITEEIKKAFGGFAISQLKKLSTKFDNKTGRQDLVAKHGYDTKFLSHAIRIVNEIEELLSTRRIRFPLASAKDLIDVKNGLVKQNQLDGVIEILNARIEDLDKSTIKHRQDNDLVREKMYWSGFEYSQRIHDAEN